MNHKRRPAKPTGTATPTDTGRDTDLRIIGGHFRGRKLRYHGDPIVRPMKHRVRESIFNLISTESAGRHAIDLFAGTGALGLEALSRGAERATFIERHIPSAQVLQENIATLGLDDRTSLLTMSAFLWAKRDLPAFAADAKNAGMPWLVFCSPPYAFFVDRQADMLELIDFIKRN
jgi:16S rRNA (guanine966-N2)-methyltransferase